MAAPPSRSDIAGTPSNAQAKTAFGALWDYMTGLLGSTGNQPEAMAAIGARTQAGMAYTTAGTAPSFTVTTSPAYGAYAAGQRMRLTFHAAGAGSDTLNMDGLGAKALMQIDSSGSKVAATIVAGMMTDVEYDGTDFVVFAAQATAATETARGVVELATAAEAQAGTDTERALTAAALKAAQLQLGTAVTASGTAIDFTGIPSWAKRVTVMFRGVSTSGSSPIQVQIGGGSVVTSGYVGSIGRFNFSSSTSGSAAFGTGFGIDYSASAGNAVTGHCVLTLIGENTWVGSTNTFTGTSAGNNTGAGALALGNALDRIRVTTVNGTDTFDAGTINIVWE